MAVLNFAPALNVAVIGASGGIGQAFVELLSEQDNVENIYGFSRSAVTFEHSKLQSFSIDITDEDSVSQAAQQIEKGALDVVIVASGLLHAGDVRPEKSLRDIDFQQFQDVFAINTFGPALVAKHFLPLLRRDQKTVFAALSARVGSIEDNRLGGWHAYRASKAALNMLLKNFSIEMARRYKQACIIGLHPGTVDTDLSKPFQGNVEDGKLFSAEYCAQRLLEVVNSVQPSQTGQVFAWDGRVIPY